MAIAGPKQINKLTCFWQLPSLFGPDNELEYSWQYFEGSEEGAGLQHDFISFVKQIAGHGDANRAENNTCAFLMQLYYLRRNSTLDTNTNADSRHIGECSVCFYCLINKYTL